MHIAIDLDDVVLDFMPSVMAAFEREYGVRPEYDGQPWGKQAVDFAKHPMFLESGYKSWWDWLRDREWLWATFPAIPGAIGGIKRLRASGHYVECVTSKPEWAEHNVWKWMGRWRPPFNQVTIVTNGQRKVEFTKADVIVDDKLATCREFRRAIWFNRSRSISEEMAKGNAIKDVMVAWHWEHVIELIAEFVEDSKPKEPPCTP